jgi:tetratricopeptide (TPR) repeat protein
MRTLLNGTILTVSASLCVVHAGVTTERGVTDSFAFHQDRTVVFTGPGTDRDEAIRKYQRGIAAAPRDAGLRIELAQLLVKSERLPEAIEAYQQALALQPSNESIELALAEANRRVHNDERARETLRTARRQHPRSVAVLRAVGSLEIDAQVYDAAIEALRAVVKIAPSNTDARNLLATAYLKKGDSGLALRECDNVLIQDQANGLARFLRAEIYADAGENERALADVEKVVAARPDYIPGRVLYAKVLVRVKDCKRAAETLQPTEQAPGLDGEGLFLLACAYDCAGQKDLADGARAKFEIVSRTEHERSENRVQSLHLVEQANALALQNKFPEAQELLKRALEKNSENAFAYSQEAKIYFSMRQPQQATQAIEMAIKLQPYQPDFLFVRGVIEASEGNLDAALAAFRSVTDVNPKEADAYYEMGKIWMQKYDRAQALAAFRKAADLAPDDNDYQQAVRSASKTQR